MAKEAIPVRRLPIRLAPDPRRTITRFFWPGEERAAKILQRIKDLSAQRISTMLNDLLKQFCPVNPGLEEILVEHYERVIRQTGSAFENDLEIQMLIGAYFSMEYAFESAALFNPSMVPADDQEGVPEGSLRFFMSLRAVGEGHLSSITFRRGIIDKQGNITIKAATLQARRPKKKQNREFDKTLFHGNLKEMGLADPLIETILNDLPDPFTLLMLKQKIEYYQHRWENKDTFRRISELMLWLARSEYQLLLEDNINLEDVVLFPVSETESQGMEDMRLVLFTDDDGRPTYFGTYTAYNGRQILPQLLEITEPQRASIHVLRGRYAQNKGMALFPRKIDGQYAMIGRIDGENLFLLKADSFDYWDNAAQILQPQFDWEFVQIGNCGSPIYTEAGWLLLTHGVGPMRKYCIGAVLLDLNDPSKIIGRLDQPLLSPTEEERAGYVPNVVYSCGAMIHNGLLVIPYGISDAATGFAIVNKDQLLGRMV